MNNKINYTDKFILCPVCEGSGEIEVIDVKYDADYWKSHIEVCKRCDGAGVIENEDYCEGEE